jgi:hypothetical protein
LFIALGVVVGVLAAPAESAHRPATVAAPVLQREIREFLRAELTAHLMAVPTLDPAPPRVWGAMTTGKFSWGTFMRALAVHHEWAGGSRLGDRELAEWLGRIGLVEARGGGVAFAQLYPALALRHFGRDLEHNAVWRSLNDAEREEWRQLLDVSRFYDRRARSVGTLSENYFGVAARIVAIAHDLGLEKDRGLLDELLDLAARPFTSGHLYADDKAPHGCFDRYSNEYARFLWDSAQMAGRRDLQEALRPSLERQMRLWWDIVAPDGYSTPWGRSIGHVSYMDTLEIVGFLGDNPEFRPAPLPELAAVFHQAWRWLRGEYRDEAHLLSLFEFGRGHYYYISPDREWQQTTGFLGKVGEGAQGFFAALAREGVEQFPARPSLPDVARFEWFRKQGRQAGVWVVRQGAMRFALPVTTGNMRPALSDYLPAPHGLPGFAAPVELPFPALVPIYEMEDGSALVATDGADEIAPSPDGRSLKVVWRRFARLGAKHGAWVDPGFRSEVVFDLDGHRLRRRETLIATRPVTLRAFRCALPTTARAVSFTGGPDGRTWSFDSAEGVLDVGVETAWPILAEIVSPLDGPEGRGPRLSIPLHLHIESRSTIMLTSERPRSWSLWLEVRPARGGTSDTELHP